MNVKRKKLWILGLILLILVCTAVLMYHPFPALVEMDPDETQYWSVVVHLEDSFELEQEEIRRLYGELRGVELLGPFPPKRGYSNGKAVSVYTAQRAGDSWDRHTIELFLENGHRVSLNIDNRGYVILSGRDALRSVFQELGGPKTPSDKYDYLIRCWSDFEYPSDRHADFPPFYSGAYMREDQEVVILVTSLDQEVIDYFASLIDLEGIHFAQVEHSIDELFAAKEWINARIASKELDDPLRRQMRGTGLAFQENKVNVYVGFDLYLDPEVEADIVQALYAGYDGAQCEILFKRMELADWGHEGLRVDATEG